MARFSRFSLMIAAASLLASSAAFGQADEPWVDPPAVIKPPAAAPAPPAEKPAPKPPEASPAVAATPPVRAAEPTETARKPPATPMPPPRPAEAAPEALPPVRSTQPSLEKPPANRGARTRPPRLQDDAEVTQARAARRLAIDYLDFWSAPNAVTLEATPEFYAPRVAFHGRVMSARALFELKRHFIRRWPIRNYEPQLDTMRANCEPSRDACTVSTAFVFTASSPDRGKRSQGLGNLALEVSFASGRPVIVSETSYVARRGSRAASQVSMDEGEDD